MLLQAANPAARPDSSPRAFASGFIFAEDCGIGATLPSFLACICDCPLAAISARLRDLVATSDLC